MPDPIAPALEQQFAEARQTRQQIELLADEANNAVSLCISVLERYYKARAGVAEGADIDYGQLVSLMLIQEKLVRADF